MKTILILEDNDERIAGFQKAAAELGNGFELKIWRDAHSMIAECAEFFASAALICLDHDLNPQPGATTDPGTGLDVTRFLGDFPPVCPVLIHSSNTDRVYSMHNELRFAGWMVDRVGPLGTDWIGTTWLRRVRELIPNMGTPGRQICRPTTMNVLSECNCPSTVLGSVMHLEKCCVTGLKPLRSGLQKTICLLVRGSHRRHGDGNFDQQCSEASRSRPSRCIGQAIRPTVRTRPGSRLRQDDPHSNAGNQCRRQMAGHRCQCVWRSGLDGKRRSHAGGAAGSLFWRQPCQLR